MIYKPLRDRLLAGGVYKPLRDRLLAGGGGGDYGYLFCSEICFRTTRELEYLFFLPRKALIFFSRI